MRREARTLVKVARVLTDAEPEFVSIVKTGANKTPFKAVRCNTDEEGENTMQVRQRQRHAAAALDPQPVHPLKESVVKAEGYEIAAIEFSKDEAFADEVAVKAWLDDGGYTGYAIETVEGGWSVSNKSAEFEPGLRTVSSGKGYDVMIGKVKTAEKTEDGTSEEKTASVTEVNPVATTKTEGGEPTKEEDKAAGHGETAAKVDPFAEVVKKFDYWEAAEAKELTLDDVLEAANDGYPAGLYELTSALYVAIRNNILIGNDAGIREACIAYGDKVVILSKVFAAVEAGDAEMVAKAEKALKSVAPDLAIKAEETAEATTEAVPAEKTEKTEEPAAKTDVSEFKPMELKEFDLGASIKTALDPVISTIETLTKSVAALTERVGKSDEAAKTRLDAVEARVNHPTRKGADVGDLSVSGERAPVKKTDSQFLDDLAARSSLGGSAGR